LFVKFNGRKITDDVMIIEVLNKAKPFWST